MVRAILNGRKTQTRRIIKPQPFPPGGIVPIPELMESGCYGFLDEDCNKYRCPFGQPGDRLWVRESWRIGSLDEHDETIAVDYRDGPVKKWLPVGDSDKFCLLWEKSSLELETLGIHPNDEGNYFWNPGKSSLHWRPSIHMHHWASRITLEIIKFYSDRLLNISESDATKEGVNSRMEFYDLWESIYGKKSFDKNPWVWVIEFKQC